MLACLCTRDRLKLLLFTLLSAMIGIAPVAAAPTDDRDGDGIVDTVDQDDDNDGIADRHEIALDGSDRDSDGDGMPNRIDLDSDNDGIPDLYESGFFVLLSVGNVRVVNGRILEEVGDNGLVDLIETFPDSSFVNFDLLNTDSADGDEVPDYLDLDSDNDGILDLVEAGVSLELDGNRDGRIDVSAGSFGNDGILDLAQLNNDQNCCDYDFDGIQDPIPRNTDGGDLPDFQDLDSDNDGINDLIEAGGTDVDLDGRVDAFFDSANNRDGVDDELFIVPLPIPVSDVDSGLPDYRNPAIMRQVAVEPTSVASDTSDFEQQPEPQAADTGSAQQPSSANTDDAADPDRRGQLDSPSALAPDDGEIRTSLNGGVGCSLQARSARNHDTGLILLLGLACLALAYRRRRTRGDLS